ncbi:TPA: protein Rem, partial [Escherichia coli]
HYRIVCLQKNGAALINFVDARVTDGFILHDGEFVTSLQALKEIGIKAGFSAFSEE